MVSIRKRRIASSSSSTPTPQPDYYEAAAVKTEEEPQPSPSPPPSQPPQTLLLSDDDDVSTLDNKQQPMVTLVVESMIETENKSENNNIITSGSSRSYISDPQPQGYEAAKIEKDLAIVSLQFNLSETPPLEPQQVQQLIVLDVDPPKKWRRTVQIYAEESTLVKNNGLNIKNSMITHVKNTFNGYDNGIIISDAKIIMEKELSGSDVDNYQGRLALPKGKLLRSFLTDAEAEYLNGRSNEKNKTTINVKVIIQSTMYDMSLSRWDYNNSVEGFKYVLKNKCGRWNEIKTRHELKKDDKILVATFRYNNVLHFAIHKHRTFRLWGDVVGEYNMN